MLQINVPSPSPLKEKPCWELGKLCRRGFPGSQRTKLVIKKLQRWDLEQGAQTCHCWKRLETSSGLPRSAMKPQNRQLQVGPLMYHKQRKVKTCPWHILHSFTASTLQSIMWTLTRVHSVMTHKTKPVSSVPLKSHIPHTPWHILHPLTLPSQLCVLCTSHHGCFSSCIFSIFCCTYNLLFRFLSLFIDIFLSRYLHDQNLP